ncbi:MAG: hypothetical protein RLZZ229_531 [Actinomycetota bacterium]|jgi:hypothetical protein
MKLTEFEAQKIERATRGASQVIRDERGLRFSRLPDWTYEHHAHAPIVAKVAERLSGVHLEIATAATKIALRYRSLRDSNPATNWIAGPSTISVTTDSFDASVSHSNGDLRVWQGEEVLEVILGDDSVASFELPPTNESRVVKIWLPHNCPIELISLDLNAAWNPADTDLPRWVHYGSSISHCEDAATPIEVWPVSAAQSMGLSITNLGLGGCANLEQFAARTIRDLPADLISLKLGINVVNGANLTSRTFGPAVHGFLDTIRDKHSETPILIISPICCPGHENNPGPSETNEQGLVVGQEFSRHSWIGELTLTGIREILAEIVATRSARDSNLFYLNGLELFDAIEAQTMPDGIHPDAEGYRVIAKHFITRHPREWSSKAKR